MGEQGFRAKQIYEWLWQKSCTDFDEMSNLSKALRDTLKANFAINAVTVKESQVSSDRTIKVLSGCTTTMLSKEYLFLLPIV